MTKVQRRKAERMADKILIFVERQSDGSWGRCDDVDAIYSDYERGWQMQFVRGDIEYDIAISARQLQR